VFLCRTDTSSDIAPKKGLICGKCGQVKKNHHCEWGDLEWSVMEDTGAAYDFLNKRQAVRRNGGEVPPLSSTPEAQCWLKPLKPSGVLALETMTFNEKVAAARRGRKDLRSKEDKTADDLAMLITFHEILAAEDARIEKVAAARRGRKDLCSKADKTADDLAMLNKFDEILAARDAWNEKLTAARHDRRKLRCKEDKTADDLAMLNKFDKILAAEDARNEKLAAARHDRRKLRCKEDKTADDLAMLNKFDKILSAQDSHYRKIATIRAKMDGAAELESWEVRLLEEDRIYEEELHAHKLWQAGQFAMKHGHQRPRCL
jgi:hypothetical protein